MKRSIITAMLVGAIFCACLSLQSCADTTYGETPYATTTTYTTYGPYGAHYWSTTEPEYYSYDGPPYYEPPYYTSYYSPPYYTTYDDHDSVVGSTAHAVGTIIAAPFRIVGDVVDTIL
jgi:hypothetical protein